MTLYLQVSQLHFFGHFFYEKVVLKWHHMLGNLVFDCFKITVIRDLISFIAENGYRAF